MSEIINLFSVPVFISSLPEEQQFTSEELGVLKSLKMNKQPGIDGNYLSDDIHILKHNSLTRIENLCDLYVEHYVKNILGINDKFKMFKSWLSMNETGTKHDAHSHRNTMISCIMYFDEHMSQQPMAPINFGQTGLDSIFKTFQFDFQKEKTNQYNSNHAKVLPRTGTVIVFPGWIKHETEEAVSNVKRYCLGTNYFFNGESSKGYHNIKINVDTE
jgi:uncharacterized protein (TIGR02466 family)